MQAVHTRRRRAAARFAAAALVGMLALVACSSNDEPVTAPVEETSSSDSVEAASGDGATVDGATVDGTTDQTDEANVEQSAEAVESDSEASADSSSDVGSITTTPPAETSDESSSMPDATVPLPVTGPTVLSDLDEEADFGNGVAATVIDVQSVEVVGTRPGERSGPGVLITLEVANESDEAISLDLVTVDLIKSDGASAIPIDTVDRNYFSGDLEAGAAAVAGYQFFIPAEERGAAVLTVSYAADVPTALFSGDLPDA